MRAHFSKAIKNHKTGDYGTERLARCLPALGSLSPTQGLPFGYPMPLLLTPLAVEEYGIDVLFCAYSLVVASDLAFCVALRCCVVKECYGDIQ